VLVGQKVLPTAGNQWSSMSDRCSTTWWATNIGYGNQELPDNRDHKAANSNV